MGSPFAPNLKDDEVDQRVSGPASVLLPQQAQQQGAPVQVPYLPGMQPGAQQDQPAAPPPRPQVVLPTPPPSPNDDIYAQYKPANDKLATDSAPKTVAPKWWERVVGGLVGAGVGYQQGATAGIQAGGAVTRRGQINSDDQQQRQIAADNAQIQGLQRQQEMGHRQYEDQASNFGNNLAVARTQQDQSNSDRNFTRETGNDQWQQSNADRQFSFENLAHGDQQRQLGTENDLRGREFSETQRSNKSREGMESQRIGLERQKLDQDGKGPQLEKPMTANQFQNLLTRKDMTYRDAEQRYKVEIDDATTPEEKDAVRQKFEGPGGIKDQMQQEWNVRLSQADPEGRYAPKGGAAPPAQGSQPTPAAQPQPVQQPAQPPPPQPKGKPLTDINVARQYLQKAGGDKAKARQLAHKDGFTF